jgi:branched-chain amino acid transport system permease protein
MLLGLDILAGYCGLVSLGHSMFWELGPIFAAILLTHVTSSIWATLGLSILANAIIGYLIGSFCIRTRGIYFVFLTFAFAQFFYLAINNWSFVGAADGMAGIPKPSLGIPLDLGDRRIFYYFTLAILVAAYYGARWIVRSPLGKVLVGIRQNEERVRFLGYEVNSCKRRAYVYSGIFGGVAGSLTVGYLSFASPRFITGAFQQRFSPWNWWVAWELWWGLIATGFVIFLGDLLSSWIAEAWMMPGTIYVICILYSPGGIFGILGKFDRSETLHSGD